MVPRKTSTGEPAAIFARHKALQRLELTPEIDQRSIADKLGDVDNLVEREARIRSWREREAPRRAGFAGDPRGWEKRNAETAKLTPLGERLPELVNWNG